MVTYWDSSALLPLVLKEATTQSYLEIARGYGVTTWWGTYVECAAAIGRHARGGSAPAQIAETYRMLGQLSENWTEVPANEQLRRAAVRLARTNMLRSGDALQLGAALVASGFDAPSARFLTEDRQLKQAAEHEGFIVE